MTSSKTENLSIQPLKGEDVAFALADENLVIFAANSMMGTRMEKNVSELIGQPLFAVIPELVHEEDDLRRILKNCEEAAGRLADIPVSINGTEVLGSLKVEPICGMGNTLMLSISYDFNNEVLQNELRLLQSVYQTTKWRLSQILQSFVPLDVANMLIESEHTPPLSGDSKEATILFLDARGFTAVAEDMDPKEVLDLLNSHFSVLTEAILQYEGTIIQFFGDSIMVGFNIPADQRDHAARAAMAALKMHEYLAVIAEVWTEAGIPTLEFGIGINTGQVVAGFLSGGDHQEYTAIGDTTNVAYHLCSKAKANQIVISQSTLDLLGDRAVVSPLGKINLKKRQDPMPIYELLDYLETN